VTTRPWLTWEQLLAGVEMVSIINEPIEECVVDFTVEESAEARARRRWGMEEKRDRQEDP
jgi:hypothetical protein